LLAGHRLPDWTVSKGIARCYYAERLPDDAPAQHGGTWDVALMGAAEGELSFRRKRDYFAWLDASLGQVLPGTTCPALLPSDDVYCAWQLARLQRADAPADCGTVTVSRHSVQVKFFGRRELCFSWLTEPSQMWDYDHHAAATSPGFVFSNWDMRYKGSAYRFRPTVCASEVTTLH
jgi:hypothetical protein